MEYEMANKSQFQSDLLVENKNEYLLF